MPSLLFFYDKRIDSTKIQGQWQQDLLDNKMSRKENKEEEEGSFSQGSGATMAKPQDIEEGEFFFDAPGMINKGDEKNKDEVFWDASDKKSKEWKGVLRMGYQQQNSEKKVA